MIRMRILQRFDAGNEAEFMRLEREFQELELTHKGFPKGRRFCPISSALPSNTLIWECDLPDLNAAHAVLKFFAGNADHEALAVQQRPFIKDVRIEFLESLF
jgi:hypothetical protein